MSTEGRNRTIRIGTVGHLRATAGACTAAIVTDAVGLVARSVTLIAFDSDKVATQRRVGIPVVLHPVASSPESFHPLETCPDGL